jgi:hypothetical protein
VWICKWWVWSFFFFCCWLLHVWSDLCNWVMPNTSHFPWQQQPQLWIHWLCARTHTTVQSIKSNKTNAWVRVVNVMFPWWQRDNLSLTSLRLNTEYNFLGSICGGRRRRPLQGASSQDWGPVKDSCRAWVKNPPPLARGFSTRLRLCQGHLYCVIYLYMFVCMCIYVFIHVQ